MVERRLAACLVERRLVACLVERRLVACLAEPRLADRSSAVRSLTAQGRTSLLPADISKLSAPVHDGCVEGRLPRGTFSLPIGSRA